MILAKRFIFFIFSFLFIFFIAFWGFKNNFPGKSIAHFLQSSLTKVTGIPIEINDLELEWQKINTYGISIFLPKWLSRNNEKPILVIEKMEFPFLSLFTTGKLILNGNIYGGKINISSDAFSKNDLELSLRDIKLQRLPFLESSPFGKLSGDLTFSAKIVNLSHLEKEKKFFPEGEITGKIIDSKIIFPGESTFFEFPFPELSFSEIFFDFQIGKLISINTIELKGSLEGEIDGSIRINEERPSFSSANINLKIIPSPLIKEKIQILNPILNPLQCNDTINVNIKGSINRIEYPTRNKC